MKTNLHTRLKQLNMMALCNREGQIHFHAACVLAFICNTPLHTAKSYWHMLKRCDSYFTRASYVNTRLSLPAADGRFRMTDVVDVKTLIYLLNTVQHPGAQQLRKDINQVGLLWLISRLKDTARASSSHIVAYAKSKGKQLMMCLKSVVWSVEFSRENKKTRAGIRQHTRISYPNQGAKSDFKINQHGYQSLII